MSSPMEGISKLSLQQITSCINNYLEMRSDTLITGYEDRPDHCEWEVKENDVTGRIWVTLDGNNSTMKNIGYGLGAGVKQQDNTVQLLYTSDAYMLSLNYPTKKPQTNDHQTKKG